MLKKNKKETGPFLSPLTIRTVKAMGSDATGSSSYSG